MLKHKKLGRKIGWVTLAIFLSLALIGLPGQPAYAPPAAPVLMSAAVTSSGDVELTFNKDMADPAGNESYFQILRDDSVPRTVSTAQLKSGDAKTIELTLSSKILGGEVFRVSYNKGTDGTVAAADGGILEAFWGVSITNNSGLDTTPPALADVPLVAGDRHPGSKRVSFTVYPKDETVTAYYVVVNHGSTAPSKGQVRDGNDYGSVDVLAAGSKADVRPNGYIINPYAELPADDTIYDTYVVISDAAGNLSEPAKIELRTPVKLLAADYPKVGTAQAAGSKQVEILNKANGDSETSYWEGLATAYYVAVANNADAPSAAQIKSGYDSTGSNALAAGNAAIAKANTEVSAIITLPADSTSYDVYVVLYKNYNSGYIIDIWSEVVKLDVTTPPSATLALSGVNPPHGQVGVVYTGHDFASNITGGVAPYTYSCSGNLTAGLTLSEAGILSGTPTASANVALLVTVEDALGETAQHTYYFNIVPGPLFINGGTLNAATQGVPYEFQLATVTGGGIGNYTWSISSGALPDGITLNSNTGYLTGTPTATGTYNFGVIVTDSQTPAGTATASYILTVNAPVLVSSINVAGTGGATTMADYRAGGTLQMIAAVLPANATNKNVTWSMTPKGPAWLEVGPGQIGAGSAEITNTGLLQRGQIVGPVTVKATANDGSGVYGETDITIVGVHMSTGGVSMIVDSTHQLTAQAVPADTTEFTWESSNPTVATISTNGLVTAVGPGTATITAAAADGRVGLCSITVAVKPPATMADLTINEGTLTPEFAPDIYEYTATVANSIKSVTISATKWGDMDASGDIGAFDLAVGANTFEIDVDGGATHADATYTIVITRKSAGGGGGGSSGGSLTGYPIYTSGSKLEKYNTVFDIPRGAVTEDTRGDIERQDNGRIDAPEDSVILGYIYEFSKKAGGDFLKPVTVSLPFSQDAADLDNYTLSIYRFDKHSDKWVELANVDVNGSSVSGETETTGRFAVIATEKPVSLPVTPPVEPPVTPEPPLMTDITGHWAETAIRSLVGMDAISGYPDCTFRPDNSITRAEFATVLAKAFNLPDGQGKVFADTAGHWAKDYIAAAFAAGIIEGYSQQQFGPEDPITREQMAIMIAKASKLQAENGQLNYADSSDVSAWAYGWVVSAVNNQLMNGYPEDNTFRPQANATRAEAMTVICNALQ